MPTYDYRCTACGHAFETFQKITADPLTTCPQCHQNALKRGDGGGSATFQFKGSGFYITDYKNNSTSCCPQEKCCSKSQNSDKPCTSSPDKTCCKSSN